MVNTHSVLQPLEGDGMNMEYEWWWLFCGGEGCGVDICIEGMVMGWLWEDGGDVYIDVLIICLRAQAGTIRDFISDTLPVPSMILYIINVTRRGICLI